jgi:hypothetical protein
MFLRGTQQSQGLASASGHDENLAPMGNVSLAEVESVEANNERKRRAEGYCDSLRSARVRKDDIATVDDIHEADNFNIGCQVINMLPALSTAIQPAVPADLVNAVSAAVVERIMDPESQLMQLLRGIVERVDNVGARVTDLTTRVDRLAILQRNATVMSLDDDIIPPPSIAEGKEHEAPPAVCPLIFSTILVLTADEMRTIETFYGLPHIGPLKERRSRIRREYNLPSQEPVV